MKGFFTKEQTKSKSRPDSRTHSCVSCGLYQHTLSPKMKPYGEGTKGILNIGEAPGETEDKRGRQWQGKAGKRLKETYDKFGIDLFKDCVNINSVNCRPPNNRTPSNYEIACCRKNILNLIKEYKPKIIVILGTPALQSLIGYRWKKDLGNMSKWRGWAIPDREFNAWVCPAYHPSFIERSDKLEVQTIWENDIKNISQIVDASFPKYKDDRSYIKILNGKEIIIFLKSLLKFPPPKYLAIDYETTGLKPHKEGHEIICCALSPSPESSFVFEMPKNNKTFNVLFKRVLTDKRIKKIAANIKYESNWTKTILGFDIFPWDWDTMITSHILDNRPGITGLKFQTYINFGVVDYDSEISIYLKAKDKDRKEFGANAINQIYKCLESKQLKKELLIYCGLDALYEHRLALLQKKAINKV